MSLYAVQKFLYEFNRSPDLQARYRTDPGSALVGYDLTDEETAAIATADSQSRQIHGMLVAPVREQLHARFRSARLGDGVDREMLAETVGAQLVMRVLFAEPTDEEWIRRLLDLVAPEGS